MQSRDAEQKVLVTGATGFVGRALVSSLHENSGWNVRGTVRAISSTTPTQAAVVPVGELSSRTDWSSALSGIEAVVHTAARVHILREVASDPLAEFRRVNVDATMNLANQAVASGVRRFVFISSIKVNGESTPLDAPFTADDTPMPNDAYSISKHEGEVALRKLAKETGMEIVIIRPVLIYGPGVKANFLSMMRWIETGIPLPLGKIENARSLVALANVVDLIKTCLGHPAAANQTFLVSDGEDLSTPELIRRLAIAMDRPPRLLPVPDVALRAIAAIAGKGEMVRRLLESLRVDIAKNRRLLGWEPVVDPHQALRETALHFLYGK